VAVDDDVEAASRVDVVAAALGDVVLLLLLLLLPHALSATTTPVSIAAANGTRSHLRNNVTLIGLSYL
jgi:hypothetical protein